MSENEPFRESPILVTGGAGFIGSHLTEALVAAGAQVTVVDNLATGSMENLGAVLPLIQFVKADLDEWLTREPQAVPEFAFIFHLAGNPYIPPSVETPRYDFNENLLTTFNLLEILRTASRRPRLISASSAAVYGNPVRLPIQETDPTVPISPYGVSKLAGERYLSVYSQLYKVPALSMRFFSVYGPRQRKQVVFDLFEKIQANPHELQIYGDGQQRRDFAFVTDIARALMLAAVRGAARGEAYNVASGTAYSIAELVQAVCEIGGVTPRLNYTGHVRPGDAEKWEVDLSRLRALGYQPQTTLRAGLTAIRDWHRGLSQ